MATYLLSWDPTRWDWRNIKEQAEAVERGTPVVRQWACGSNRRIFKGDEVYFIRQGREPRGLFARGEVVRGSYEAANVDVQDAQRGNTLVIDVKFLELFDAANSVPVSRNQLKGEVFGKFVWEIREHGTRIPDDVASALATVWKNSTGSAPEMIPDEITSPFERVTVDKTAPLPPQTTAGSGKAKTQPVSPSSVSQAERDRLRAEREERLAKIKARDKSAAPAPKPPEPAPLSETERHEILVQNYFVMLDAELQGELYSMADHRNRILKELGETDAARVDTAHGHIGALLADLGLPAVEAFPPQAGAAPALQKVVRHFIEANPELVEALWLDAVPPHSSIPVELDDPGAHWVPAPQGESYNPPPSASWHPDNVQEVDFRVRENKNEALKTSGERFVLAFERARLRKNGQRDDIKRVAWQSQTHGDSYGYDILSYDEKGGERRIVVKTTNFNQRFPFTLNMAELDRLRQDPARFFIYRVFRFSRGAKLFILSGKNLDAKKLQPVAFRLTP